MSDLTREHLDAFWELVDGILTAVLFLLIGMEIQVIPFNRAYVIAGIAGIGVILVMIYITVVFSIIVQGLSLGKIVKRIYP